MKLIFIFILAVLIDSSYSTISKGNSITGEYLELDHTLENLYMFSDDECVNFYICEERVNGGLFGITNHLRKCYLRNSSLNEEFSDINNPDDCDIKGYADINLTECYISSEGNYAIYKGEGTYPNARYYDITDNRVLTEFGWCNYSLNEQSDSKWMANLPDDLKLNQINIPGTHDSGTYGIYDRVEAPWARTQNLNIKEQLLNGIRYVDIRIETNKDKEIYISHEYIDSLNKKICENHNKNESCRKYYLSDVFDEAVEFVHASNETVIIHLKNENLDDSLNEDFIGKEIYNLSLGSERKIFNDINYRDFFYPNNTVPTLGEAKGKVVLYTRPTYKFNNTIDGEEVETQLGIKYSIPDMGNCKNYKPLNFDEICYPIIYNGDNTRVQDNYHLSKVDKWNLVQEMLDHEIPSRSNKIEEKNGNYYGKYIIYGKNDNMTNKFYDTDNKDVLTINFMNVAVEIIPISETLSDKAKYINYKLSEYFDEKKPIIHNEWFILDYPTNDLVRKIYESNINKKEYKSDKIEIDNYNVYTDFDYHAVQSPFSYKRSDSDETPKACLQRKFVIDEKGNQQDLVKTNYKCVDNKLYKWRIRQNGNYYNIISSYDAKCLNSNNGKIYMQNCELNNKYEDFIIKNGIICSRVNQSDCLDGDFKFTPTVINRAKYEHLSCSAEFARQGFYCCDNQNTEVRYVDDFGNWSIENNKLCGIGYKRCSWNAIGYPCCSSVDPKVVYNDDYGSWGFEDGEWCGIDEINVSHKFRIKNKKTQECLITNLYSDDTIVLLGDCNHSEWTYKNEELVLDATGKCLYAMNSQNARMIDCNNADNQINHHIHFKVVDNKYICIKNNIDPNDYCLDASTLNFETNKSEYSEWIIESLNNDRIIYSIDDIIKNNPSLRPEKASIRKPTTTYKPTTAVAPTSTTIVRPTVTVKSGHIVYWFYHAFTNKCLYAPSDINGKISVKSCDETIYSKWMVLSSRKGYFYSMAYPDYCLRVDDLKSGSLTLGVCDDQAKMEHNNDGFFKSLLSDDKCIGLLDSKDMYNNEIEMNLNPCTYQNEEMFFIWDHNPTPNTDTSCPFESLGYPCCTDPNTAVVTHDSDGKWGIENNRWCGIVDNNTSVVPSVNTETYYLYNAYTNKCIHSDGIKNSQITLQNCDYSLYSLWNVPYTHNGYFHLKFNENYCLMVDDNLTLMLGECGDTGTTFYRDGNYIISELYADKCITSDANNGLVMADCNEFDNSQIFYFNLYNY